MNNHAPLTAASFLTAFLVALAATLVATLTACSTPRGLYESAIDTVNQPGMPDNDDAIDAFEDLDEAVVLAKEDLRTDEDARSPCYHDQTAYIIPMARLAKARLHGRLNQVSQAEEACWTAIDEASRFLGRYVAAFVRSSGPQFLFANYSVFFRREKVRRHGFTVLKEIYRKAGERDLEELMRAQITLSDIYLRSSVAHDEEEFIRLAENSDWVRRYNLEKEDIGYTFTVILFAMAMAAQQAAYQQQQAQLQQGMVGADPATQANLQAQMQQLEMQMQTNMQQMMETARQIDEAHNAAVESIQNQFRNTVVGALVANFEMLELSAEVKNLASYHLLQQKKEAFDNYVARDGFDQKAAAALHEVRTSLDDLTRDLQLRRER